MFAALEHDVRVLPGLRELVHRVQLRVELANLLRDVPDLHLVLHGLHRRGVSLALVGREGYYSGH